MLRARRRAPIVGLAVVSVSIALLAAACSLVTTTVNFDCQANPNHILLPTTTGPFTADYQAVAPESVPRNTTFSDYVTGKPFRFSGAASSNGRITKISAMVWKVAVPANATLLSHSISNWSNLGAGTPTSTVSGGAIVVTMPGPMLPDVDIQVPTVKMDLKATGAVGSTITVKLAGTSYSSPGLTFNTSLVDVPFVGTLNPSLKCFPSPNPDLHTTTVTA